MAKMNYQEGNCFAVPLRDGGYARGIVARTSGQGVAFGYFFGPRLARLTDVNMSNLNRSNAVLTGKFGDLGLINGEWKVIGAIPHWDRSAWPMPHFVSDAANPDECTLAELDEDTFELKEVRTVRRSEIGDDVLPDNMMGYGFVEIRLTRYLPKSQ